MLDSLRSTLADLGIHSPDTDLTVVAGVLLLMLSIPSMLAAFADGRPPRVAVLVALIGAGLLALGLVTAPPGYGPAEIPHAFIRMVDRTLDLLWPV